MIRNKLPTNPAPMWVQVHKLLIAGALITPLLLTTTWPQIPRPAGLPQRAHAEVDGLALTPPMGWYPWNMFGEEPQNEKLIKEIAEALVASGMKDAGYAYVGPDEGDLLFTRQGRDAHDESVPLSLGAPRPGR